MVAYVLQLLREVKGRRSAAWTFPRRPWRSIFLIFGWVEWAGTGGPGRGQSTSFSVRFLLFFKFVRHSSFFPTPSFLRLSFSPSSVGTRFSLLLHYFPYLIFPFSVERDFSSFRLFVATVLSSLIFRPPFLLGIFAAYNTFFSSTLSESYFQSSSVSSAGQSFINLNSISSNKFQVRIA